MEEKNKTIQIFLASSEELHDDRVWFGDFVQGINKIYQERGKSLDVFKWEFYDAANNDRSKQDEYNDKVRESNMFLALFHKKAGKYTLEEYDVAMETYRKSKRQFPKVYVYCKKLGLLEWETPELKAFKAKLSTGDKEYFWITYSTRDQLHLHFLQQLMMVENSLDKLKYEEGKVTLEGLHVADIDNLPFAANNKNYKELKEELDGLPEDIELAQQACNEHPDSEKHCNSLQRIQDRKNYLIEELDRLQKALFETSQRIAKMQQKQLRDKLRDKLRLATEAFEAGNLGGANALLDEIEREAEPRFRRATEAFEAGNLDEANALLDEIINDPEPDFGRLSEVLAPYHQKIEALLLQAKTVMAEVNTPVSERIQQVQAIYAKADQWAKESALPDEKYEGLLDDYSDFLYDYGLYKEAKPVYLRLITLREALYGPDHPDTAASYNNIGVVYDSLGDYAKALEYYWRALDIRERVLAPDHPDTAASYNNIGLVYHSLGDYAKALKYLEKALDIRERVLGPDHPDTAQSYNNIGAGYHSLSDYAKALEYYGKALDICERVLGPDHPNTASSYNNIGLVYCNQGDYAKALEYYGKALDIQERVLGPDHPDTASSYNNIGAVYKSQGDYAKALEYLGKALDIQERVLGPDHPDTATSYNNIGLVYYRQGDYAKALDYYKKALAIWERKLGPDHPKTKTFKENILICSRSGGFVIRPHGV